MIVANSRMASAYPSILSTNYTVSQETSLRQRPFGALSGNDVLSCLVCYDPATSTDGRNTLTKLGETWRIVGLSVAASVSIGDD